MAADSRWEKFTDHFRSEAHKSERAIQRKTKAKMEFSNAERKINRATRDIQTTITSFKKLAFEAQEKGQERLVRDNLRFVKKLNMMQLKIDTLAQRFKMFRAMSNVSDTMVLFSETCNKMSVDLMRDINLGKITTGHMNIDIALDSLDTYMNQIEDVFDSIDSRLNINDDLAASTESSALTEEEQAMLNGILVEFGGAPATGGAKAVQSDPDLDEIEKTLRETVNQHLPN